MRKKQTGNRENVMKPKDVMTENMAGVAPDTSLDQTARKYGRDSLTVITSRRSPAGMKR